MRAQAGESPAVTLVDLPGVDGASLGARHQVVIRDAKSYEAFIEQYYVGPLRAYWDANYDDVKASQAKRFPDLQGEALEKKIREVFHGIAPFCFVPEGYRDFNKPEYPKLFKEKAGVLVGYTISTGGTEPPTVVVGDIVVDVEAKSCNIGLTVTRNGMGEAAHHRNVWIWIEGVDPSFTFSVNQTVLKPFVASRRD